MLLLRALLFVLLVPVKLGRWLSGRYRFKAVLSNPKRGDGDSFFVISEKGKEYHIRLLGVDAPEWNQPLGRESSERRRQLTSERFLVRLSGSDAYGRSLARVRLSDGRDLARVLISEGYAYNRGASKYAEFRARVTRRGIWGLRRKDRIAPEVYRST